MGYVRQFSLKSSVSRSVGSGALALVVVGATLLAAPAAYAAPAEVTVCASGCDYTSIQAAIDGVSAGSTVSVAEGTYSELVSVSKSVSIVGPKGSVNPVATPGDRGSGEAIMESTAGEYSFVIQQGVDGVVITGFSFEGSGVVSNPGSSNVTISNNVFTDHIGINASIQVYSSTGPGRTASWSVINNLIDPGVSGINSGIQVASTDGLTISGNAITNTGYAAMNISGSSDVTVSGNIIENTPVHGINLANNTGATMVDGNVIDSAATSTSSPPGLGTAAVRIYGADYAGTVQITGNTITNSGAGILIRGSIDPSKVTFTVEENSFDTSTDAEVDYAEFLTDGEGDIPATTFVMVGGATFEIPATGITASDPTWDGVIQTPTVVPNSSVAIPAKPGTEFTVATAIEIGAGAIGLSFDKGVRITLPGQASKLVGFVHDGTFTQIAAKCAADSQATGDALAADGDCYISVGADMVIWTKHFSTFVAYSSGAALANTGTEGALPLTLSAMLLLGFGAILVERSRRKLGLHRR